MEQINKAQIKLPDWSFKNMDAKSFKSLKNSILKNGQTKNIIVRLIKPAKTELRDNDLKIIEPAQYEVIDGRCVFAILKKTKVDFIYCHVYKDVSKTEAKFIYLQHDFHFVNNFIEIAKALQKICKQHSKFDIAKVTPLSYQDIQELLTIADYDFDKFEPISDEVEQVKFF